MEIMPVTNEAISIGIPRKAKLNPINIPSQVRRPLKSLSLGRCVRTAVRTRRSIPDPKRMRETRLMVFPFLFMPKISGNDLGNGVDSPSRRSS
jgi:hypothetical protein